MMGINTEFDLDSIRHGMFVVLDRIRNGVKPVICKFN